MIVLLTAITGAEVSFFVVEWRNGGGIFLLKHFYMLGIVPNLFGTLCTIVLFLALLRIRKTIRS